MEDMENFAFGGIYDPHTMRWILSPLSQPKIVGRKRRVNGRLLPLRVRAGSHGRRARRRAWLAGMGE